MQGFIYLHRKMLDNPIICKDTDHMAVWIYLLLNATHKSYDVLFEGSRIVLTPGQLITGRKSLASKLKINESKVQRILKTFEIEQQIEQQTTPRNRLITILNWSVYQNNEQQIEQQLNNKRTTTEQQLNTNNNVNNVNNVNKEVYTEIINAWNQLGLAQIKSINSNRLKMVQARVKEYSTDEIVQAIESIKNSSFLKGQNKNNWIITFDWFIKPNNFVKVLEGNYLDKEASNGNARPNDNKDTEDPWGIEKFITRG